MVDRTIFVLSFILPHHEDVMRRTETRRQRYEKKLKTAKKMPVSVCMVNFGIDSNVAFMVRTAVCYGAESVMIIGNIPDRPNLHSLSGSTSDLIPIIGFSNPHEFLEHCRKMDYNVVSAELCEGSTDLNYFDFDFSKKTVLVLGSETTGVPGDIILNSSPVYIQMNGPGFCLNTSVTGSIILNEYHRQYSLKVGAQNAA
jgi:tRNA G18 (ribose-2'-O)-methylase SpoU